MIEKRDNIQSERAFLVGAYSREDEDDPDLALDELASLVEAAGGLAVGRAFQRRSAGQRVQAATYIGRGKAEHVAQLAEAHEANVIVFDAELSPAQIRELEKIFERRTIDRSELILDIFASRARTKEARSQVELAQLQYTAPRLRGMWTHLERQAGQGAGMLGGRGPGEKQIEIDRRLVTKRITLLRNELKSLHARKQREVEGRINRGYCVGLVGYTNAGKSTLMNKLTDADTYVADQLFATLDTRTRRWQLGTGAPVLLSDTVGFVSRLPHQLVASFRATLEEALHADLLLHVIDASHPQALEQIATVERVLKELDCEMGRIVPVLNKVDVADPDALITLRGRLGNTVAVSARTGEGIEDLETIVSQRRSADWSVATIRASAGNGRVQAFAHTHAVLRSDKFEDDIWVAEIELPRAKLGTLRGMLGADDALNIL